jgi:hypothetical protein
VDGRPPASKHLFLTMMENHSTDDIIGSVADAPFINNQLLKQAGVSCVTSISV